MPYVISGTNKGGAISHRRETLEDAHNKAIEMENDGFENVTIRDEHGRLVGETEEGDKFNENH
jgi:hypothetical protein